MTKARTEAKLEQLHTEQIQLPWPTLSQADDISEGINEVNCFPSRCLYFLEGCMKQQAVAPTLEPLLNYGFSVEAMF